MFVFMKILIFLIIVFLIIVYLFTYIRYKRLHRKQINTVQAFHDTYDTATNNQTACDHINTDCVDFIDKEDFISGIQAEIKENNQPTRKTIAPRMLKF